MEKFTSESVKNFWDDGALLLEGFFNPPELEGIAGEIQQHYSIAQPVVKLENFDQFETRTDPWSPRGGVFEALARHPLLVEITKAVLGPQYADHSNCLVMQTRPGTGQAWHQDTPSNDPVKFILNRIVYFRDVTPEAGGILFVPGSHRKGRIPPGPNHEPLPGEVPLHPKAGTLVLLHSFTWHRVSVNRSDAPRWSANFRCRPSSCPEDYDGVGFYRNSAYNFRTLRVQQD
jgi:hypothetical protein